jgi:zinc transporter, ZIP family
MLLIALIDKFIPSYENPHEMHAVEEMNKSKKVDSETETIQNGRFDSSSRWGAQLSGRYCHFYECLHDPAVGVAIAVAVAIHNIPEGIAVSVPIYYATGSRRKAFFYSFLVGTC